MRNRVALRKESVDRNQQCRNGQNVKCVALRKESVDRNSIALASMRVSITSLSARRAWIEICRACCPCWLLAVALRKESVDRNTNPGSTTLTFPGRSPQGERG